MRWVTVQLEEEMFAARDAKAGPNRGIPDDGQGADPDAILKAFGGSSGVAVESVPRETLAAGR